MMHRRQVLCGLIAAPLVVQASSLMKIVAPAQGFPYYGGLATLKTYPGIARDIVTTVWDYRGRINYSIGYVTTGIGVMQDPRLPDKQMALLKNVAENAIRGTPGYMAWLMRDRYGHCIPGNVFSMNGEQALNQFRVVDDV